MAKTRMVSASAESQAYLLQQLRQGNETADQTLTRVLLEALQQKRRDEA